MPHRHSSTPRRRSAFAARLTKSTADGDAPRVLDDLRGSILSGAEPPGTLIPIDEVARFFGVSQIPVREALKVLAGEGMVEHVPNVGYSVAKLRFSEFRELYDVRRALEVAALRLAVEWAGPNDDAAVDRANDEMDRAMVAGDERAYHAASREFHLALIRSSQMVRLVHMYESAWNITEPARPMARVPEPGRTVFFEDHRRMAEAFHDRDAARLVAECDEHYAHLSAGLAAFAEDPDAFEPEHRADIG